MNETEATFEDVLKEQLLSYGGGEYNSQRTIGFADGARWANRKAAVEIEHLRAIEQTAKDFADGTKEIVIVDNLMGNADIAREIARIILTGEN